MKNIGRNPKCDRDWIKVQRKKWNKSPKRKGEKSEKRNKSPKRKGKIKVQREKGNKSPNKNWKK